MTQLNQAFTQNNNIIPFLPRRQRRSPEDRALDTVLQGGKVALQYQPQFDLGTGMVRGMEALLRVKDRHGNSLDVAAVVADAERGELIAALGQQILKKACTDFSAMRASGCDVARVAVNVSPLELRQPNYAELVIDAITAAGLEFGDIELEITESWPLWDPTLCLQELTTLSDLGITIALDDFGTGHATWVNALALPVHTLKIDRSLIRDLGLCKKTLHVVRSICQACRDMGLEIVAEGVCNREQRRLLIEMQCGNAQGYGLAMPMSADRVINVTPLIFDCLPDQSVPSVSW